MKNWKYLMLALVVTMIVGTAASASAFEARGSAVITGVAGRVGSSSTYYDFTEVNVTNIAGSAVTVRVKVYDHDGTDVTQYCTVYTGDSSRPSIVTIATGTGTFELQPAATRKVLFQLAVTNKNIFGHAVIEWSSTDEKLRKAIIAHARREKRHGDVAHTTSLSVDNGQAF